MQNVTAKVSGNILTLTIDLSQRLGPSSTGKTMMIATTKGNATAPGTAVKFGLNVFTAPGA